MDPYFTTSSTSSSSYRTSATLSVGVTPFPNGKVQPRQVAGSAEKLSQWNRLWKALWARGLPCTASNMRTHRYVHMLEIVVLLHASSSVFASQDRHRRPRRRLFAAPAQIDETIVNLPTTLSLERHGSYFRLTHRFARDLGRGSFGDLAQDLFGLDNGAIIGLEYRYGITSTCRPVCTDPIRQDDQTFGRWDALRAEPDHARERYRRGIVRGANNMRRTSTGGRGYRLADLGTGSRCTRRRATCIRHTRETTHTAGTKGTIRPGPRRRTLGTIRTHGLLGIRRPAAPAGTRCISCWKRRRAWHGYDPDEPGWNVAVEKRTRGHILQLNFGNNFNTTPGQTRAGRRAGQCLSRVQHQPQVLLTNGGLLR